jgi:hypothetical protein
MPKLLGMLLSFARKVSPVDTVCRSYGEFEATRDCSDFTCASFLNKVGKKTPVLQRVSTVGPESGSADTSRDVHGWSMKLYTDEGNLDWVFNNTVCAVAISLMLLIITFITTSACLFHSRSDQVPVNESVPQEAPPNPSP